MHEDVPMLDVINANVSINLSCFYTYNMYDWSPYAVCMEKWMTSGLSKIGWSKTHPSVFALSLKRLGGQRKFYKNQIKIGYPKITT